MTCALVLLATGCGGKQESAKNEEKGKAAEKVESDDGEAQDEEPSEGKGKKAKKGAAESNGKEKKGSRRRRDPEFARAVRRLDDTAEEIGEFVRKRDVRGLRALWIADEAFVDCHVTKANLEAAGAAKIRAEYSAEFEELVKTELAKSSAGELVFVNRRANKHPTGMGGRFVGDDCNVEYWARVNAIVFPDANPSAPIEHRFNLLMVDGKWKIYRYLPIRPDCAAEDGPKMLSCDKLRERTNSE
jgi:hypothetical protein